MPKGRPGVRKYDETAPRPCRDCGETKSIDQFLPTGRPRLDGSQGRRLQCRTCGARQMDRWRQRRLAERGVTHARGYLLERKYGLTVAQFTDLWNAQSGCCAICDVAMTQEQRPRANWCCIDHDHITGRVRGLLCFNCNTAIGKFRDDPEVLRAALRYLEG